MISYQTMKIESEEALLLIHLIITHLLKELHTVFHEMIL